jgi:2-isopropylmalate synthase
MKGDFDMVMKNAKNYIKQYYDVKNPPMRWTQKSSIEKAPKWCSVDLRDGNQALITPMSLEEKLDFFQLLVKIGFKEIEVGFPAASETEYEFCRTLIEKNMIPDDVTIQVLTQAREHIIAKTFKALEGAKSAVIHLYNSTSFAQRQQVFRKSKEEIKQIAVTGAKICQEYREKTDGNFIFEYSPESFTGTEPEFALEVCNEVINIWKPTKEQPVIINLPVTVELSMPHVYANQVEFMNDNLDCRENVIISLHPHNDRGCAVADSELGLLAGGDRIEGTLFGNGERTGNVDIITLAMNMFSQGVDPELDFTDMPSICQLYERVTRMKVYDRSPYSGKLVFAAFSGSHQDAIAKGMKFREETKTDKWTVPYLPINPEDVGRKYETDVIRINSQSGKGGIGYIMETKYGFNMPKKMREAFGYMIKNVSDHAHRELQPSEIYDIFKEKFINTQSPIKFLEAHYIQKNGGIIGATVKIDFNGEISELYAEGNGRLDAVSNAVKAILKTEYTLTEYTEHSVQNNSKSDAVSYISIENDKKVFWGVGIDSDITTSSSKALISAVNAMLD